MLNYWFIPRPQRKLIRIPSIVTAFSQIIVDQQWSGQVGKQRSIEDELEKSGIKKKGERRDKGGSGARTYYSWLESLGLVFEQESTGKLMLTLAGKQLLEGKSPVEVLTKQIITFQYPSAYSLEEKVDINPRFKIRPFAFILKLLVDNRINYLLQQEIGYILAVEAENESNKCYESIVQKILDYRKYGDSILLDESAFIADYGSTKSNLNDMANTMINWLEYTQLIDRFRSGFRIAEDKEEKVKELLEVLNKPLINRPHEHEYFQRKYGVGTERTKDDRNLTEERSISIDAYAEMLIRKAYVEYSLLHPLKGVNNDLIDYIQDSTGCVRPYVEEKVGRLYPHGNMDSFLSNYYQMAFNSREESTEFEKATAELFDIEFGYKTKHVGPIGLTPDVLLVSDEDGYQAIIDNKAYSHFSITNDYANRMKMNYIPEINRYSDSSYPIAFFTYISGGFKETFDNQLEHLVRSTHVNGSGVTVANIIRMVEQHSVKPYTHKELRDIFSVNRRVSISDIV